MGAREEIAAILATSGGVFVARRHPQLRRAAERLALTGELRRLQPGVYVRGSDSSTAEVRIRAAAARDPDAVLTGASAARLTFWPNLAVGPLTMSVSTGRASPPGIRLTRERLPPELITEVDGTRVTVPALTALDLAEATRGASIDRALRLRKASLAEMAEALNSTLGRVGNKGRREWLLDSRDEPWSAAEREGHRLLRAANIKGWQGNLPVHCGEKLYFLDAGTRRLKLGIEIDGREVHGAENALQFLSDRRKWTTLVLHGWTLLHFGANHVFDEADWFLDAVRQAEAQLRRRAA